MVTTIIFAALLLFLAIDVSGMAVYLKKIYNSLENIERKLDWIEKNQRK